jgi:hypothetical protein
MLRSRWASAATLDGIGATWLGPSEAENRIPSNVTFETEMVLSGPRLALVGKVALNVTLNVACAQAEASSVTSSMMKAVARPDCSAGQALPCDTRPAEPVNVESSPPVLVLRPARAIAIPPSGPHAL